MGLEAAHDVDQKRLSGSHSRPIPFTHPLSLLSRQSKTLQQLLLQGIYSQVLQLYTMPANSTTCRTEPFPLLLLCRAVKFAKITGLSWTV